MKKIFLIFILLTTLSAGAAQVTKLELAHIAEIATNIFELKDPAHYPRLAYELGKFPCDESLQALALMLEICEGKGDINQSSVWRDNVYLARSYALYAMARIGSRYAPGQKMLQTHFEISRPLGMALLHVKPRDLMPLMQQEVGFLTEKFTKVKSDTELYQMKNHVKGSAFILANCTGISEGIKFEDYLRILEAISLLEATKSAEALPLLNTLLGVPEARYWEKPVFRAVFNLKIDDAKKLDFYKKAYADTRNKTVDPAPVNLKAEPEFDIRTISGEAHLILLISRLEVPLKDKAPFYEKSLASKSFTAREAVVDSLVREGLFDKLNVIFSPKNRDNNLKYFTIYRLGYDSAAGSKDLLKKVASSTTGDLAEAAKEALKIK